MKRKLWLGVLIFALVLTAWNAGLLADSAGARSDGHGKVQNVIFMIGDGFSAAYATNYRLYKGDQPTLFDQTLSGMIRTASADNAVTDSAAAATAMATGVKTNNDMVGMAPDGKKLKTILEAAKESGKSTGLVSTSSVTHATPASFAAKVPDRDDTDVLAVAL